MVSHSLGVRAGCFHAFCARKQSGHVHQLCTSIGTLEGGSTKIMMIAMLQNEGQIPVK